MPENSKLEEMISVSEAYERNEVILPLAVVI
jgi:hypothetical protein